MYIYDDHIIVFLPYFFPLEKNYYHERLGNKNEGSFWNTFFFFIRDSSEFFYKIFFLVKKSCFNWWNDVNWCNLTLLHTQTLKNRIQASFFASGSLLSNLINFFFFGKAPNNFFDDEFSSSFYCDFFLSFRIFFSLWLNGIIF